MKRRRIVRVAALLIGVPLLLLTIVLLYLNFADLSGWRDRVANLASDAIGRELRINGEFQPEVGFTTRVVATDVTLANADWSDDPHMLSVNRFEGEIDLLSIVFGPITIDDVEISGARVLIEVNTSGELNWEFESSGASDGDGEQVELVLAHILAKDVWLAYRAPDRTETLEATITNLESTADERGILDLDLVGGIGETPVEISGRLGTFIGLINAAAVEHDLTGHLGDIEFSTSGKIAELTTLGGADLTVAVHGPDLIAASEIFGLSTIESGSFQVDLGVRPAADGSNLELAASVGAMTAEIAGTVDSLIEPGMLDVTVEASGPDVSAVGALTGVEGLPVEPFAITGHVRWEGFPVSCDNVEVRVGENSLTANGVIGEPPLMLGTDFTFDGEGPDISSLAGLAGVSLPKGSFSVGGRLVRLEDGVEVEKVEARVGQATLEVNGTVGDPPEYAGTALTFRAEGPNLAHFQSLAGTDLPADAFEVNGKLSQGKGAINLESVRARLGRNAFQVGGQLSTGAGFAGTNLRLRASGPDASKLAAIGNVSDVPAEPYRVDGRVRVLERGYRVSGLVASLGTLGVTVDGFVAPPPTLIGSDLQLHVEDSNISHPALIAGITGLPHDAFSVDTRLRLEDAGYRLDGFKSVVADMSLAADGLIGTPPELDGTRLQFSAHGPRLASLSRYLDQTGIPPVPFSVSGSVRVAEDGYALDGVSAEIDGNHLTVNGTLLPVEQLVGTKLEIELAFPNLGQAVRLAHGFAEIPELPEQPLTLTTRLAIDNSGYLLDDLRAAMGETRVAIDGRVGPLPEFHGTDLTIDSNEPDAALFRALTGVTTGPALLQLKGRIERGADGFQFHGVTARLGDYRASIDGTLGELPKLIGTDLELRASGPSLTLIGELAGLEQLPGEPFRVTGRFKGTPELFTADGLEIALGESDLTGSLEVDIRGKPAFTFKVVSNRLDLSPYIHPLLGGDGGEPDEGAPPHEPGKGSVISNELIDFGPLQRADADVDIEIGTLQLPLKVFRDVRVGARLAHGRLEVHRFSVVGQREGQGSGTLLLEPVGDAYRLHTELDFDALRLDLPGKDSADVASEPPIDLDVRLDVIGKSPHGFASSANGSVQVVIGKGVMDNQILDMVTADFLLTLLTAFNPFAKEDVATELQCGVMLVDFEDGLAKLEPMALQSDKMTMLGKGKINLGTEKLNLEWITKPRKGVGISASMLTNPYIKLGGTLGNPAIELKPMEAVASTGVAVATMGVSLVAKGFFDRVTADKKVCKKALKEIESRARDSSK